MRLHAGTRTTGFCFIRRMRRVCPRRMSCQCSSQQVPQAVVRHACDERRRAQQSASGKRSMTYPCEGVEAARVAVDRFGDELAGEARERKAMAGEALQVVDALELLRLGVVHHIGEAAEIGCAVHRDVDEAAPRVLDLELSDLSTGLD